MSINETEQLVLLALAHLGEEAYGVTVQEEIEGRSGRSISIAAVYACLDRLERAGHAETWISDPTPERGGRAKKHFRLTPVGASALRQARAAMDRMWEGVGELPTEPAS
ncbi:MAG: helix-turn-helix transcriptional regulator [Gemmatimonadota bacterium]|jgi:DNA-binding PadR family transcriptional regulator